MPSSMEVEKANAGPPGAEGSVIDPADDRKHPQENGSPAQAEHLDILLLFQFMHKEQHGWYSKSQQDESIHNISTSVLKRNMQFCICYLAVETP